MPVSKRVADLDSTQTFSNKTLDSSCTFESLIQSYTLATLPDPSLAGRLAWLTDGGRGLFADIGTQWVGVGGDVANIRNFGATGLGQADDHEAIQAAIDTGLPVYVPDGIYLCDAVLVLTTPGQAIYGNGAASIIRSTNPDSPLWAPEQPLSGVSLQRLRLEGAATDTSTSQKCIETQPSEPMTDVLIYQVQFSGEDSEHGFNWAMVANTDSHRWHVVDCLIERLVGSTTGFGYGFITGHSNSHVVAFNNFIGTPGRGRHAVYLSGSSSHSRVIGNTSTSFNFEHITTNADNVSVTVKYNVIFGNVCVGGGSGAGDSAAIGLYGKTQYNLIGQNVVTGYDGHGITVSDSGIGGECISNTLFGNVVERVQQKGILIAGAQNSLLVSNHVHQASQESFGTHAGIDVRSNASFGVQAVDGTVLMGNLSYGDEQRCGFNIDPTSPLPTNTVCKGNVFGPGVAGNGYQLNGAEVQIDGILHRSMAYTANMTVVATAETETINKVVVTDSSNFTINTPSANDVLPGKYLTVQIFNESGGALGTATWTGFHLGDSWTQPADNKNRSITFRYDGNGWIETYRSTVDVTSPS